VDGRGYDSPIFNRMAVPLHSFRFFTPLELRGLRLAFKHLTRQPIDIARELAMDFRVGVEGLFEHVLVKVISNLMTCFLARRPCKRQVVDVGVRDDVLYSAEK